MSMKLLLVCISVWVLKMTNSLRLLAFVCFFFKPIKIRINVGDKLLFFLLKVEVILIEFLKQKKTFV